MNRSKLLMAVIGMTLSTAALAAEPGVCKSMCTSEKQECRQKATRLSDIDSDVLAVPESKNPYDRANNRGLVASVATQERERSDRYRRISERTGQCDATYLRCTRACDTPGHTDTDSVILRRRQPESAVNAGAAER
jgi:regulator of extracellular matrix RemA (YlzA/DUF370 family)